MYHGRNYDDEGATAHDYWKDVMKFLHDRRYTPTPEECYFFCGRHRIDTRRRDISRGGDRPNYKTKDFTNFLVKYVAPISHLDDYSTVRLLDLMYLLPVEQIRQVFHAAGNGGFGRWINC